MGLMCREVQRIATIYNNLQLEALWYYTEENVEARSGEQSEIYDRCDSTAAAMVTVTERTRKRTVTQRSCPEKSVTETEIRWLVQVCLAKKTRRKKTKGSAIRTVLGGKKSDCQYFTSWEKKERATSTYHIDLKQQANE